MKNHNERCGRCASLKHFTIAWKLGWARVLQSRLHIYCSRSITIKPSYDCMRVAPRCRSSTWMFFTVSTEKNIQHFSILKIELKKSRGNSLLLLSAQEIPSKNWNVTYFPRNFNYYTTMMMGRRWYRQQKRLECVRRSLNKNFNAGRVISVKTPLEKWVVNLNEFIRHELFVNDEDDLAHNYTHNILAHSVASLQNVQLSTRVGARTGPAPLRLRRVDGFSRTNEVEMEMKRIPSLNLSHASSSFDNFSFLSMPYDSYQTDVSSLTLVVCCVLYC